MVHEIQRLWLLCLFGTYVSKWTNMTCEIPQGSILGPLTFNLYVLPLSQIVQDREITDRNCADCACEWMNLNTPHRQSEMTVFGAKDERFDGLENEQKNKFDISDSDVWSF